MNVYRNFGNFLSQSGETSTKPVDKGIFSRLFKVKFEESSPAGEVEAITNSEETPVNVVPNEKDNSEEFMGGERKDEGDERVSSVNGQSENGQQLSDITKGEIKEELKSTQTTTTTTEKGEITKTEENKRMQRRESTSTTKSKTKVTQKIRRQSADMKSGGESQQVFAVDAAVRRGSLVKSPLGSFANVQEKILALSRDQSQTELSTWKRTPKVNKLNEDAFRMVKFGKGTTETTATTATTTTKPKEPIKMASKVDVQSKLMKFGEPSGGRTSRKSSVDNSKDKPEVLETNIVRQNNINGLEKTQVIKNGSSKSEIRTTGNETSKTVVVHKETTVTNVEGAVCAGRMKNENKTLATNSTLNGEAIPKKQGEECRNPEIKENSKEVTKTESKRINTEFKTLFVKSANRAEGKATAKEKIEEKHEETTNKSIAFNQIPKALGKEKKMEEPETKLETEGNKTEIKANGQTRTRTRTCQLIAEKKGKEEGEGDSFHRELVREAMKVQETMQILTKKANHTGDADEFDSADLTNATVEKSRGDQIPSDARKDEKTVPSKTPKKKSNPDECYPKTQKLLVSKPVNAYEQANLDESKQNWLVSPAKVEAFLRENLNPPLTRVKVEDPVKTMDAVVEEIVTSTSNQSKHNRQMKFSSKGEVIRSAVSIKPANREDQNDLSAITLVPGFRAETPASDPRGKEEVSRTDGQECSGTTGRMLEDDDGAFPTECPDRRCNNSRDHGTLSPVSDFSDESFDHYIPSVDLSLDSYSSRDSYFRRRSVRSGSVPRRIFPQVARQASVDLNPPTDDFSSTVFDASMSFDLASNRTSPRQQFKPQPAFTEDHTASNSLSLRIAEFLNRTDHIMEEWRYLGKGGDDLHSLVQVPTNNNSLPGQTGARRKSATNILIKGLLNFSKGSRNSSVRSRSTARTPEACDRTISDIDELSEMTMDLSEERATGTMQAERLEAETAERVRLEQELSQIQNEKKNLQQASERLEMELFYARADVKGLSESEGDLEDGGGDAALYKNKCERAMRELEFTRRRLQQQHEDDLEQLVGLKKQLEKKLSDAYEEVDEQRQVAGQWKRKVQKLQSEMNDLRLLLEVQSSRNNLLEKKQRKFDSEIQLLQDELRSEKNQKDHMSREKEMAYAEKYSLEQNLSSVRLELELKDEKLATLTRELEEFSRGGGSEQEVTQLRKAKHDLDMKLKEQEEELDELAGQVSMLEGNKLRLEMSLESLRKEHRREMAQRDDELDEARSNSQKKIKVLETQLESEHEERTLLVREKHELERRLANAEERGRHSKAADEDALLRARRDLKKTKALLRDAQVMLERAKQDSPSKAALRALKNQLEDAELARASAVKAKQSLDSELSEVNGMLEEALRAKGDAENRCQAAVREMNALRTQVDESEEELAELLKKYRQTVQQLSAEQLANQETAGALAEAEAERQSLRDQLAELTARLEANAVIDPMNGLAQKKLEIRIKELESRLDMEQTTRGRLEIQITRLKENVERLNEECLQARTKEQTATDLTRKLQRSLREAKEDLAKHQAKEQEASHKRKELEKRLETAEHEASTARTDLRLAVKRIEDLQSAISGEIGSDSDRTESEEDDSGDDSLISHVASTISSTSRASRTPDLTPR